MLQYVVAEAAEAGVEEVIVVSSPGKESIAGYFSPHPALEKRLADGGDTRLLETVLEASRLARVSFVVQERALGLGHAVLTARGAVGDEPFAVILPDDIVHHSPGVVAQMVEVWERVESGVVAVEPMPWETVHNYGVVDAVTVSDGLHQVRGMVEKPLREEAPSNLSIVGRYILPPDIFDCLERTAAGAKAKSNSPTECSCFWKARTSTPTSSKAYVTTAAPLSGCSGRPWSSRCAGMTPGSRCGPCCGTWFQS